LFGIILAGLLVLLFVPILFGLGGRLFAGRGYGSGGRSFGKPQSGGRPRIKLK
jgi:hypothetical protein